MCKDALIIPVAIFLALPSLWIICRAIWRHFHRDPWDKMDCASSRERNQVELL
jgi:hypothetical protein